MSRFAATRSGRGLALLCVGHTNSVCGTGTVTRRSLCPTGEYGFHRMYFRSDLSFSRDVQSVFEEKENEGSYRG